MIVLLMTRRDEMEDNFDAAMWAYELMLEQEFKESDACVEWVNKWIQDQLATAIPTEVFKEIV
jgi:hypothetical protein